MVVTFLRESVLNVCSYHVTYAFHSKSTLYSCLNFKQLLARSRRQIWSLNNCNWNRSLNHLVHKQTRNHLVKQAKWLSYGCEYLFLRSIWLYVLIMSRMYFRVNPHSIVDWMSKTQIRVQMLSLKLQISPALSKEFLDIQATCRVWIHSETGTWHDKNIQSNAPYRRVLITQLNHMASLAKWLSVRLWMNWLWVRVQLLKPYSYSRKLILVEVNFFHFLAFPGSESSFLSSENVF